MWAFFVGDFMAIQTVDLTVPGGDTPRSANTKLNANFSNQTHAASRLVGTAAGNVMEVGALGLGAPKSTQVLPAGFGFFSASGGDFNYPPQMTSANNISYGSMIALTRAPNTNILAFGLGGISLIETEEVGGAFVRHTVVLTSNNTTKDANGFLKGASPVVDLYDNKIGLNHDAEQQGGITFEKLTTGDYLIKGSLGFAQDGWYIETPKDANGNVLVAVVYEQSANNDISIKTYAKRFDDETGDIVANLLKPRDIPAGRFISLRLHELPKEPPVMPTQDASADAPAQTTNP